MKRLIIAVVLLALTAGLCAAGQQLLEKRTDRLLTVLDELEYACRSGDSDAAVTIAARFAEDFPQETHLLPLFLPHATLEAAAESAAVLPALAATDFNDTLAEIARCRSRLEELRNAERLTMENIL